jgi:hypothetical protein
VTIPGNSFQADVGVYILKRSARPSFPERSVRIVHQIAVTNAVCERGREQEIAGPMETVTLLNAKGRRHFKTKWLTSE